MSAVLDAGAVVELLLRRGFDGPVRREIERASHEVRSPELLDVEVLSVFRRLSGHDVISQDDASRAVRTMRRVPIQRVAHRALAARIWDLRGRLTSYDAAYLATAERPGRDGRPATLVTTDARFGRTVRSIGSVQVVVIPVA
ncbi:type II toxin-antitoxin system VapC family toxin [Patulibacter sp. NPDC049589]|uniref:type II toxin-antitoxin system VapC family toxin n=1 Tax=Patulibacter sp. NPDC049589 TaxID=3154731 RepID=UPI003422D5DD